MRDNTLIFDQISALIDISAWQQRRDGSLRQDQLMLRNELNELLANQRRFTAVLGECFDFVSESV